MATMPSRSGTFRRALTSILPQVDRLFLFFDRFERFPDVHHHKIIPLRSQEFGDLGAAGKFLGMSMTAPGAIYLGFDDDVFYPPDYAQTLVKHLQDLKGGGVVGLHCAWFKDTFNSYRHDRFTLHRAQSAEERLQVHMLGSDTFGCDTGVLRFDPRSWAHRNMVDLQLALECARRGLPRYTLPRARRWVRVLEENQPDSIWAGVQKNDQIQTELARELIRTDRAWGAYAPTMRTSADNMVIGPAVDVPRSEAETSPGVD